MKFTLLISKILSPTFSIPFHFLIDFLLRIYLLEMDIGWYKECERGSEAHVYNILPLRLFFPQIETLKKKKKRDRGKKGKKKYLIQLQ